VEYDNCAKCGMLKSARLLYCKSCMIKLNILQLKGGNENMDNETQETLRNRPIGTKEKPKLKPAIVKIVKIDIEFVEKAKNNKVVCTVKHPESEDEVRISSVKVELKNKTKVIGMWCTLDEDENLDKNSGTVVLLKKVGASTIQELEGKECDTVEDDGGYLAFKAY